MKLNKYQLLSLARKTRPEVMVAFSYPEFGIPANDSLGFHISWSGQLTWLKIPFIFQHEKKCRQERRKRLTKVGKEMPFHQFKIVLKLQLQSLNLDALLKGIGQK